MMDNPSWYLYGPGDAKLEEADIPVITEPHDVIVRISFVGVCGSDVHFWAHGGIQTQVSKPLIMGHEASGIVTSIGNAVTTIQVGDRVAIEPGHPCRRCKACKSGHYNLCTHMKFAAAPPDVHGCLTKFWKSPEDFLYKIADHINLEQAVLAEPLAVAVHATKLAEIKPGQTVVVIGAGTIGVLTGAVARTFGAHRVILLDIIESKLEFARQCMELETYKLDMAIDPEESASRILKELDLDNQIDVVIEASGASPSVQLGIYLARLGGTYVQTGIGKAKVEVPLLALSEKELHVRGCFRYGSGDFELAVKLINRDAIPGLHKLITSITSFEHATEAWEKTKRGEGIKNLIRGFQD